MTLSAIAVLILLGCSVAFSVCDLLRKVLASWVHPIPLLFALSAGLVPAFFLWHLQVGAPPPISSYWLPGLGSSLINIFANLAFLEAVRRSPLSLTIPLLSLTPVFTTILAVPLLGEVPTSWEWLGIVLVVIGVFWLNLDVRVAAEVGLWRAFFRQPGSRLMILVALLWSLAMPLDKLAVLASGPPFHGLVLNLGVASGLVLFSLARGRTRQLVAIGHRPGLVVAAIVMTLAGLALQLVALTMIWVGLVETVKRALGSFLALIWGRLVFGEELRLRGLLAVLLIAGGVSLILL